MTYPPPQGAQPYPPQQPQPQGGYAYPPQQPAPPQGGYAYPPPQPPQQQPYAPPQFGPPQQPQQPYPPQQIPYPQQQGPYPPQQGQQPWTGGPPPVAPQPSGGGRSVMGILKGIGTVVVLVAVGIAWIAGLDDADSAEVGDCMTNHGNTISPDLEVVDCGTAEAEFTVSAVHEDTTDTELCSEGTVAYTETITRRRGSDTSFVLCLTETP